MRPAALRDSLVIFYLAAKNPLEMRQMMMQKESSLNALRLRIDLSSHRLQSMSLWLPRTVKRMLGTGEKPPEGNLRGLFGLVRYEQMTHQD